MKVFYSANNLPKLKNPVITVGSFDGVHGGHRVLLDRIKSKAAETGGESVVVTFSPHPRQVLAGKGDIKLLNTLPEKIHLLEDAGIDALIVMPFNESFASLSPEEFIGDILVGKAGMKHLVVGFDHRFGRGKEGDSAILQNLHEKYGFSVEEVSRQDIDESEVSSTIIRKLISEGEMSRATELLSHSYIIIADIRHDRNIIVAESDKLLPPRGKYPVKVTDGANCFDDIFTLDSEGNMRLEAGVEGLETKNAIIAF